MLSSIGSFFGKYKKAFASFFIGTLLVMVRHYEVLPASITDTLIVQMIGVLIVTLGVERTANKL